jgi:hypothetical protein
LLEKSGQAGNFRLTTVLHGVDSMGKQVKAPAVIGAMAGIIDCAPSVAKIHPGKDDIEL